MPKKWSEIVARHSRLTPSEREEVRREIEESVARIRLDELHRASACNGTSLRLADLA
jgi:hypothetical protein